MEYILGEKVRGACVRTAEGNVHTPAWATVLELDFQLRKQAYKNASQKRIPLKKALADMREDMEAGAAAAGAEGRRDLPGSGGAASSLARVLDEDEDDSRKAQSAKDKRAAAKAKAKARAASRNGAGKGADKSYGKSANKDFPNQRDLAKMTLDRKACFKHQKGTCKNKDCKWAHICALCAAYKHKH